MAAALVEIEASRADGADGVAAVERDVALAAVGPTRARGAL